MPINKYLLESSDLYKIRTRVFERAGLDYNEYVDLVLEVDGIDSDYDDDYSDSDY